MYKVIEKFTDIQDDNHVYEVGDVYPREGLKVDEARIQKLLTSNNRRHMPMIAEGKASVNKAESLNSASPVREEETPIAQEPSPKKDNKKKA